MTTFCKNWKTPRRNMHRRCCRWTSTMSTLGKPLTLCSMFSCTSKNISSRTPPNSYTVVSRKYAPPFATLGLVQSAAGGAYTRDATFSLAMRGIKIPLHNFALKMQGGLMREGGPICGTLRYFVLCFTNRTHLFNTPCQLLYYSIVALHLLVHMGWLTCFFLPSGNFWTV